MPLIKYVSKRFGQHSLNLIETANEIIESYSAQGFSLTLRQLYYQFVATNALPNTEKSYSLLGNLISDARLAGMIDWNAIEDRTRFVRKNTHWNNPSEIVEACSQQYQTDKWAGQQFYVEVWIEKDALVGVIEPTCRALDVPCFSCRGYTSQTAMWDAAQRMTTHHLPIVFHLGDHDPSGLDMTRDIQDRLSLFATDAEVRRIALTIKQVRSYNPPPNPAKVSDSRAAKYIEEYGDESWELDALKPNVLVQLVEEYVCGVRQEKQWKSAIRREKKDRKRLKDAAAILRGDYAKTGGHP